MNKTIISLSIAALFSSGAVQAATYPAALVPTVTTTGNNFTMVGTTNGLTGGTNDVTFTWDGTYRSAVSQELGGGYNATLSSPTAFSGKKWTAHHVNVYGPGDYTFYTDCASGGATSTTYDPSCGVGSAYTLHVGAGQVGAHMLFNWSTSFDIDVVVLWDMNQSWAGTGTTSPFATTTNVAGNTVNTVWSGVSIDTTLDADNYSGTKMIDGPFVGQSANFSVNGIVADSVSPTVTGVSPADGATGSPLGSASYSVTYSETMQPSSMTSGALTFSPAVTVGTPTSTDGITWNFPVTLAGSTAYTVTFNAGPTDMSGNAATLPANKTFTTAAAADTTSPTISARSPASGAAGVATSTPVVVTFSEAMGGSTANAITLSQGGTVVPCTFVASVGNTVFTCTPASALWNNTTYTVSVAGNASRTPSDANAAQDAAGNNLITAGGNTWTFTTAPATTLTDSGTGASVTVGTGSVVTFAVQPFSQIGGTPLPDVVYDSSGLSYTANGVSGSVLVTLTFPTTIADKTFYKVDSSGTYTAIPPSAYTVVNATTIAMTIVDRTPSNTAADAPYDTDTTTGTISDPIVAGVPAVAPTLGSSPGGGGCAFGSNSKFDPAMLMMLLGSLGYLGWKRKQRN